MGIVFEDAERDGQFTRTLTAVHSGSADLGEAFAAAARIDPASYDSWYDEWAALARRTSARADEAAAAGHRVTARQGYLRATEYWRQAIFFIRHDLDDELLQAGWRSHRAAFRSALPLLDHETVTAEIPLGPVRMTAYLFRSPVASGPARPVVLAPCGYDSTAEAGYAATAYMAVKRGYDCLVWEGPGQGGTLYDQRVPMRPDFEAVLAPAVDWVLAQPGTDPDRLAVVGRSFAGYLAPRGVSGEGRVAALVCDPGQYDFVSRLVGRFVDQAEWERILAGDRATDRELEGLLADEHGREWFGARMATQGAATVGDFLRLQPGYTLEGRAEHIACPTLVTEGEGDFSSQSQALYDALRCPKALRHFSAAEGGGGHCEGLGATLFEEVVFDWLDATLA